MIAAVRFASRCAEGARALFFFSGGASTMRKAAILAALLVPAFGGAGPGASALGERVNAWTTPHVLTISDAGDPNTLNPHVGQSAPVANLSELTMAWLVR